MRLRSFLLPILLVAASAPTVAVASDPGWYGPRPTPQTIRFPGYDPRLGSLHGYRAALIEAVDLHIAAIRAGYAGAWQVEALEVLVPPHPHSLYDQMLQRVPPGVAPSGAITGAVGTTSTSNPSDNRQAR